MELIRFSRFVFVCCFVVTKLTIVAGYAAADPAVATKSLPEAIASFGAVTSDGWIYVYGGHIGTAHDHSKDNLSQSFRRRSVNGGDWEELPMETPLQGLALVAYKGAVYRIGGMTAKNSAGQDAELYSTNEFAKFDPVTKRWTALAALPSGRSSHDAVVISSKVYVVGGWNLAGGDEGEWHTSTLVFDLGAPDVGWTSVAQPFERRALAATHLQGRLYVIGGMNASHDIDRTVNVFDPVSASWSIGPKFPGEGMNGFGVSAWNNGQALWASGSNGVVYRLTENGKGWSEATRLVQPRFFHRIVPGHNGDLLALGGASQQGHLQHIERIELDN